MDKQKHFSAFLNKHPDLRFIRLLWIDYTATLRARVLTVRHMRQMVDTGQNHGLGRLYMTLIDSDAPLATNDPTAVAGQSYLIPDFSSLRICGWVAQHAAVFCHFGEGKLVTGVLRQRISELCPRFTLQKRLDEAARNGLQFLVGFEIEFVCFIPATKGTKIAKSAVHQASGLRTLEETMLPILCRVTEALEQSGIVVQHFHAESEKDQFELVTGPCAPMEAVDKLFITREVIHKVCLDHGVGVSFHPSIPARNGLHLNISLDTDLTIEDSIGEHFLAGIFEHISAIFAFALPHPESYDRIVSGHQCVGRYKTWGTHNREVPIRKKGSNFWEMRFLDASTNVYLCLAAIVCAGLTGVEERSQLKLFDCNGKTVDLSCATTTADTFDSGSCFDYGGRKTPVRHH